MSSFRRYLPIIGKNCRLLSPRSLLHTTSILEASRRVQRAPSLLVSSQKAQGPAINRPMIDPEKALPPIVLLQSASKSGALEISPDKAMDVLRRYQELERGATVGWEQRLCKEFEINPSILVLLSMILNRCPKHVQRSLARRVMLSASELGEESATFYIISSALRTGVLKDYASPLKRLGTLAKAGNPRAMALLGKFLLTQNKENEALDWIRRATRGPAGLDFEDASEALVSEGQILKSRGDVEGAQAAFRTAALELDNPTAYFYLSQLEERNSRQQEVYLLKAASSGILEAWHNLGAIELARLRAASAGPVREFGMAKEWFQVAAADGFGPSMLNLAQICKAEGQAEEGMRWLEKAEKLPEVKEQALKMMDDWRINQDSTSS